MNRNLRTILSQAFFFSFIGSLPLLSPINRNLEYEYSLSVSLLLTLTHTVHFLISISKVFSTKLTHSPLERAFGATASSFFLANQ